MDAHSGQALDSSSTQSATSVARVEPAGVDIEVRSGETLFDAAFRAGYTWPSICMGQGTCTHCHVRVLGGRGSVSEISAESERRAIKRVARRLYGDDTAGVRLACSIQLSGDVVVEQQAFDPHR